MYLMTFIFLSEAKLLAHLLGLTSRITPAHSAQAVAAGLTSSANVYMQMCTQLWCCQTFSLVHSTHTMYGSTSHG